MKKVKSNSLTKTVDYLGELSSNPLIKALSQLTPVSGAIISLFSGEYHKKKEEELIEMLHLVYTKVKAIEKKYIDNEFFGTESGKRVFAMAFRSLIRDSRRQKIDATANLLANLVVKSKITYDERELFMDILDDLNPFHLAVLERIYEFNKKNNPNPRYFEPSGIASYFKEKGIDEDLTHQAIAILANYYIVNIGSSTTFGGGGTTHAFTYFGEKFYVFVSEKIEKGSPYLV